MFPTFSGRGNIVLAESLPFLVDRVAVGERHQVPDRATVARPLPQPTRCCSPVQPRAAARHSSSADAPPPRPVRRRRGDLHPAHQGGREHHQAHRGPGGRHCERVHARPPGAHAHPGARARTRAAWVTGRLLRLAGARPDRRRCVLGASEPRAPPGCPPHQRLSGRRAQPGQQRPGDSEQSTPPPRSCVVPPRDLLCRCPRATPGCRVTTSSYPGTRASTAPCPWRSSRGGWWRRWGGGGGHLSPQRQFNHFDTLERLELHSLRWALHAARPYGSGFAWPSCPCWWRPCRSGPASRRWSGGRPAACPDRQRLTGKQHARQQATHAVGRPEFATDGCARAMHPMSSQAGRCSTRGTPGHAGNVIPCTTGTTAPSRPVQGCMYS